VPSVNNDTSRLRDLLESIYNTCNHREHIGHDPLQFLYKYSARRDREIAAFFAACLAYGRVEQIRKSLNNLFRRLGRSPFDFVRNFSAARARKLRDFKHRFTTGRCLADLMWVLKDVLAQHGSLENFFIQGYSCADKNIIPALSKFCDSLFEACARNNNGHVPRTLSFLLPRPSRGSPCKRLNLFLRWMVRCDNIDAGLWKSVDKAKLIIPLDVHLTRLTRILGFHNQKNASLKTAVKITECFARIEPADPVKYDFALCRFAILAGCTGLLRPQCRDCDLYALCHRKKPLILPPEACSHR
jgi:uncharacterized protein (TIGR02757 family)